MEPCAHGHWCAGAARGDADVDADECNCTEGMRMRIDVATYLLRFLG